MSNIKGFLTKLLSRKLIVTILTSISIGGGFIPLEVAQWVAMIVTGYVVGQGYVDGKMAE